MSMRPEVLSAIAKTSYEMVTNAVQRLATIPSRQPLDGSLNTVCTVYVYSRHDRMTKQTGHFLGN
jgi:hypothetical protein